MKNLPILFAGTPHIAASVLQTLLENSVNVVAVLTRPDAPVGRRRVMTASPVAELAEEHHLPIIKAEQIGAAEREAIAATGAQLGVVVAYGVLLDAPTLETLPQGWVNLHYSLLPRYRGAAPAQWALINAEEHTGVSIFALDEGMDTGPIYRQRNHPIAAGTTAGELLEELNTAGAAELVNFLAEFADHPAPQPQNGPSSMAPKLGAADAQVDFTAPTQQVAGRINGLSPFPGARAKLGDKELKFARAYPLPGHTDYAPGQCGPGGIDGKTGMIVGTADGAVLIPQVQPAGKKMMDATDFLRGHQGSTVFGAAEGN